jgi:hypothetical protein
MPTAAIQFTQSAVTGGAGQAFVGVPGAAVTVSNATNAGVVTWSFSFLSVPTGSSFTPGVQQVGATPTFTFTPDVPGSFVTTIIVADISANTNTETRSFLGADTRGWLYFSYLDNQNTLNYGSPPNTQGWEPGFNFALKDIHDHAFSSGGGTVVVFQPGGTAEGTFIFTDFPSLAAYAASLTQPFLTIGCDGAFSSGVVTIPDMTISPFLFGDVRFEGYLHETLVMVDTQFGGPNIVAGSISFSGFGNADLAFEVGDNSPFAQCSFLNITDCTTFQNSSPECPGFAINPSGTVNLRGTTTLGNSSYQVIASNTTITLNAYDNAIITPGAVFLSSGTAAVVNLSGSSSLRAAAIVLQDNTCTCTIHAQSLTNLDQSYLTAPGFTVIFTSPGTTQIVYQPGGVATGTVFTDWPTLMAYVATVVSSQRALTIYIDGTSSGYTATIPAGTYDFGFVALSFVGLSVEPSALVFTPDVQLLSTRSLSFKDFASVSVLNTTSPFFEGGGTYVYLENASFVSAAGALPVINASNVTTPEVIYVYGQTTLANNFLTCVVPAVITINLYDNSAIQAGAISLSGGATAVLNVTPGASIDLSFLTAPGVTVNYVSQYIPAAPSNWNGSTSLSISTALDRLAAAVAGLLGGPIP